MKDIIQDLKQWLERDLIPWAKTNSFILLLAMFSAACGGMFLAANSHAGNILCVAFSVLCLVFLAWACFTKADDKPIWFWQDGLFMALGWYAILMAAPVLIVFLLMTLLLT